VTEQSREERIRARAHQIWEEEGRPEGRSDAHWERATIEVGLQDNQSDRLKPAETTPTEPVDMVANQGELPTPSGQGERHPPGQTN
jgi:hypothetical protein